jgi:O-antigen/teichoic acid export membrane protein
MFKKSRSKAVRHQGTLLFTGSNTVLAAATFLGSFVCARLLKPSELGAFQTTQLFITYLTILPLGTFNGFSRQYPYLIGRGQAEKAAQLSQVCYTVARFTAFIAAIFGVGQLIICWKTGQDTAVILAAAAAIPMAALMQINTLQFSILAGRQSFGWIGRAQLITAIFILTLLVLVWRFGVIGQCVRIVITAAIPWIFYGIKTRDARQWCWNRRQLVQLIKIGVPIMAIGYLSSVFSVADRTLVASLKGVESVGYYSLAGLTIAAIQSLYTPLAVATYSKANHAYGKSHQLATLVPAVKRFLILLSVTVLPLAGMVYYGLPKMVPWLLPKYAPGIPAAQVACIASVAFCYCGTGFVFNVTGHNWLYGGIIACGLAAFFLIGYRMPGAELTLERVAWLRAGTSVAMCLLVNGYLWLYLNRGIRREAAAQPN